MSPLTDANYSGPEKRYLPRWEVNNRVLCRRINDLEPLECRSVDLSCSGVCLILRQSLNIDEKVKLTIYLTESQTVEVTGHIVWNKESGYGHVAGIVFEDTPLDIHESILKYAFEFKKKDLLAHWFEGWTNEDSPPKTSTP